MPPLTSLYSSPYSAERMGYVHSLESLGTLDGPGLRTVVFLEGCPLKCIFCHNIDCGVQKESHKISVQNLVKKVLRNKPYWDSYEKPYCDKKVCIKGGVTISGGESTFQPLFLRDFLQDLKKSNVHIALDSCLITEKEVLKMIAPFVDLWMVSIKHTDPDQHKFLTGVNNILVHKNLKFLDALLSKNTNNSSRIRIRFLIIPGLTDSEENIKKTGEIAKNLKHLESLELLPYGSHGKYKWEKMFGKYPLDGVPDASPTDIQRASELLKPLEIPILFPLEYHHRPSTM